MRNIRAFKRRIEKSIYTSKVQLFFATKLADSDYGEYSENYTNNNLNPIFIKCFVRDFSPERLTWKEYGLKKMGMKEIICDAIHKDKFKICNEIKIEDDKYQVYSAGASYPFLIQEYKYNLLRIVVEKKNE